MSKYSSKQKDKKKGSGITSDSCPGTPSRISEHLLNAASNYDEDAISTPKMTKKKKYTTKNIGQVGYTFRKQFEDGWYWGEVVKIRPGAGK